MKLYLIIFGLFLTLFEIESVGFSLTYGDLIFLLLLPVFINDALKKRIVLNKFSKLFLGYIVLLLISGIMNLSWMEGQFLNIFKTNLFCWFIFTWIYSLVVLRRIHERHFVKGVVVLFLMFLITTWREMQTAWAQTTTGFKHTDVFSSSLNLNTWGFIILLFIIFMMYTWSAKVYPKLSFISFIVLSGFLVFSYSRTAYGLMIFTLIFLFFYIRKDNFLRKNLWLIAVIPLLIFLASYVNFSLPITESATDFINRKVSSADEDFLNTRIYMINIDPLIEKFSTFNILQIFIGDGYSVQHSWIAHNLIVTGLVGFTLYFERFRFGILNGFRNVKPITESKFFLLLVIVFLANDFITNTGVFLPFAGILAYLGMGYLLAMQEVKKTRI